MKKKKKKDVACLVGVSFASDGHKRITKGDNFVIVGGDKDSHEKMQETVIKFNEHLNKKKKNLEQLSSKEFVDILNKVSK